MTRRESGGRVGYWLACVAIVWGAGCSGEAAGEPALRIDAGDRGEPDAPDSDDTAGATAALHAAWVRARQREGALDARYHVVRGATLEAHSPERRVRAQFSDEVTLEGEGSRGTLRTSAIRCDEVRAEAGHTRFTTRGDHRVERALDAWRTTEWIENGPLGFEQGYDVYASGCAELAVELEVDGLRPELAGDSVRLVGDAGALRYAQLFALDATGRSLPARFVVGGQRIELVVDTRDATWPVVVDPLIYTEERRVSPLDEREADEFGYAVAVDGDRAVIGSRLDDNFAGSAYFFARSGAGWAFDGVVQGTLDAGDFYATDVAISGETAVVNAAEEDDARGAAYVYVRSAGSWSLQARLTASDATRGAAFGSAVAIDGDTLVVGAPFDEMIGAAYVFVRSGTTWSQEAKLTSDDREGSDFFGSSVGISGDTALVGAPFDDDRGGMSGSAYVFTRSGTTWTQRAKLTASDGGAEDQFGELVLRGDTALIGAPGHAGNRGAAYVFVGSGSSWSEQAKLEASDGRADDYFGARVGLDGDRALIGAFSHDDAGVIESGAAYVFVRSGTAWSQEAKLVPSDVATEDEFGRAVALAGDTVMVSSFHDDDLGLDSGSAYVFRRDGSTWSEEAKLTSAPNGEADAFGSSVTIAGDLAVVGSDADDAARGSVYVFVRTGGTWSFETELISNMTAPGDRFGGSVALSGSTLLVGAGGSDAERGAVYVFVRTFRWFQRARLTASDGAAGDRFGQVALEGDTAVVGAPGASMGRGAAYVFVGSGTTWDEQAKLVASDGATDDAFGSSVGVSAERTLVGAPGESAGYVFARSGVAWSEEAKLVASTPVVGARLGWSAALSGDTALLGAPGDDTGVGSVGVFVRSGGAWSEQATMGADDGAAGDHFGWSVAFVGDTALVGAPEDDDGGSGSGSAYVFTRSGVVWSQDSKLQASDVRSGARFGGAVALEGVTTLVGAELAADPFGGRGLVAGETVTGAAYFGRLAEPGANGTSCASAAACLSGFCVDGVCCDTACGDGASDDCRACSVAAGAAMNGTCGASTGNTCEDGLACTAADVCSAGTCTGASPCDEATSCSEVGDTFECSACPTGTFSSDGTGATACTTHRTCMASEYETTAPTATRDRVCAACTVCEAGEREVSACTATADTVCAAGDAGVGTDAGPLPVDGGVDAGRDAGGSEPGDGGGCGCRTTTSGSNASFALLVALVWWARRRAPSGRKR